MFLISTGASAICLLLGIWLFGIGVGNQGLQSDLQKLQQDVQNHQQVLQTKQQQLQVQQEQINAGNTISQQVGPALLREMAIVSAKDDKMKKLLKNHGYEIKDEAKKEDTKPATPATTTPRPSTILPQ